MVNLCALGWILIFVGTTMISMYAECGDLVFARKVFEEMWQPNAVTRNAIVRF